MRDEFDGVVVPLFLLLLVALALVFCANSGVLSE